MLTKLIPSNKKELLTIHDIASTLISKEIYKRFSVETCINFIANTFANCEFKTFQNGEEVKKNNYYLFNVQPNMNDNAYEFKSKIIHRLYHKNECLVVQVKDQLFIADSFVKDSFVLKDSIFSQVMVDDFMFRGKFKASDVYYFKLHHQDVMRLIDGFYKDYGTVLESAKTIYKRSNAKRFSLSGDFFKAQTTAKNKAIQDMLNEQYHDFLNPDVSGSIIQVPNDFKLEDFSGGGKAGLAQQNSRDIRSLVDDIFDYVASAFHVPRAVVKGDSAEISEQIDNLIMFCMNPLAGHIQDAINSKLYTQQQFANGSRLEIDTSHIKTLSINDLANASDKLFGIGFSHNDIRDFAGKDRLNEDWADEHHVTKNYASVTDRQQDSNLEGGETTETDT